MGAMRTDKKIYAELKIGAVGQQVLSETCQNRYESMRKRQVSGGRYIDAIEDDH